MQETLDNQELESPIPEDVRLAWSKTLECIEKKIRPQYFQSFILTVRLREATDDRLVLGFPEKFHRDWVQDHYSTLIQETFDEVSSKPRKLEFTWDQKRTLPSNKPAKTIPTSSAPIPARAVNLPPARGSKQNLSPETILNSKYGFETFVVGASNQFAHAASFTVAEEPGRHYNPLLIYGDVGLGKTHLLNAIGLKIQEKFPAKRVHYTTFERFMNHMIECIRFDRMEEFQERYRKNCDVLIIDDIQFISGKEKTQEEFFHTFNALYEHHKQIVLSSDRAPKDIQNLEDRLRSRFEMGLVVDIQAPEMETRVAIVYKKAETDGINLPEEVAFLLAKTFKSNIRELEGALLKLSAFASLTGSEITVDLARQVLKPEAQQGSPIYKDPEDIMKLVSRQYKITLNDLKSDRKNRELSTPRQLAMFLCRKYSNLSLPDIGTLFGGKNHTTVLHAVRRIGKLQEADPLLRDSLQKIENDIRDMNSL